MSQTKEDQVLDIISDGLIKFVNAMRDKTLLQAGATFYRDTQNVFVENICPVPGKIDSERSKPERDQQKWQRRINSTIRSSSLKS